jgi:hypothetical protein
MLKIGVVLHHWPQLQNTLIWSAVTISHTKQYYQSHSEFLQNTGEQVERPGCKKKKD